MKKKKGSCYFFGKAREKVWQMMKLRMVLIIFLVGLTSLPTMAQDQTVTLKLTDVNLYELFDAIRKQTGLRFLYNAEQMKEVPKVSVDVKNKKVKDVLTEVLTGTPLTFEYNKGVVTLKERKATEKPQVKLITITGRVVDEKGNPIPGATVLIQGTTQGVATDVEGAYTINVRPDDALRVSFIGYKTEVVEIKGKTKINIRLNPTAENIEEVTVVAFGEQKKESVVAAITTVNPEALRSSSSDLTTQFAGKIPGMIAWQTGGLPGALTEEEMNTKFYIRGITSFQSGANIDPLILIDGVESSKLDLARIAPEDIESFSVMKDASATAMYGARGANGVILVTTKKGEEGSVYTSLRYEAIASMPTREIEVVDPVTYMKMYNQAIMTRNPNATPEYSVERIERTNNPNYPSFVYPANDWYKILFKDYSINHHMGLNIRGGSRVIQYYASLNYIRDEGMLKTEKLNQFDCNVKNNTMTFRANLNIDLSAGIRLLLSSSASLDKYHGPLQNVQDIYYQAFTASPVNFAVIYPADETYNWPHIRFGMSAAGGNNPYMNLHKGYMDRSRYSATVRAEYIQNLSQLLKGLEVRASVSLNRTGYYTTPFQTKPFLYRLDSYDFETGKHKLYPLNAETAERTLSAVRGDDTQATQTTYEIRGLHTAAWGEHQTSLTGVFNMQESTGSPVAGVLEAIPHRNMGLAMRGTYGFRDRYFLEASFGYNGSERFDKGHQWGFFPAVGMAWIASKENFLAGASKWLSFLKFRLSWGEVGNDGIISSPRFTHLPTLSLETVTDPRPNRGNFYRDRLVSYPNSKIKWEIAEQVNLGIETKLFNGLFEVNADIYQEIRHNIIDYRITMPATVGLEKYQLANVGKARSRGIDLSGKIQHAFSNDFWIILNGTFTYSKAVYLEIEEAIDKSSWQRKKGKEISQSIGYIAEGLFQDQAEIDNSPVQGGDIMPGDIRYRDLNEDGVIDVRDATYIGFPETPRVIYGFSGFINYKNFEFNFAFQGSGKRGFFMDPMQINPFVGDRAMLKEIYNDHWSEDNMKEHPFWPRLSTQSINVHNPQENWAASKEVRKSTYFMRECSFLRCTSIELAYNMPQRLMQKIKMQNLKFYARVNNPFIISNFKIWDVELGNSGFNYPIQRTFSLGLNLSF